MDIEGLGEEAVVAAARRGLVRDVADLYDLDVSHFVRSRTARSSLPLFGAKTRKGDDGELEIVEPKRADKVLVAIEESKAAAVRARAVRPGHPPRRVGDGAGARGAVPEHGGAAGGERRGARRRARDRTGGRRGGASSSSATSTTARPSRSCAPPACGSSRTARRARRVRSPGRRSCSRASSDAHARAGAGAHRGGRRAGEQFGEPGDRLRRRRRGRRLQARQGAAARRRRCSTRPACAVAGGGADGRRAALADLTSASPDAVRRRWLKTVVNLPEIASASKQAI